MLAAPPKRKEEKCGRKLRRARLKILIPSRVDRFTP
jgi:hypothetical protein